MNATVNPALEPHRPDTQPRRSIYYQYQVHPACGHLRERCPPRRW